MMVYPLDSITHVADYGLCVLRRRRGRTDGMMGSADNERASLPHQLYRGGDPHCTITYCILFVIIQS